jgi:transposase
VGGWGCNGIGRHVAQRLVADGEPVVDVPAKLSARARVFSTGPARTTDPVGAHWLALVGLGSTDLRVIAVDDATVALRLLVDRRGELGVARWQTFNRIHRLLLELLPGGANKDLSAVQARTLLATVRLRDILGKTPSPSDGGAEHRTGRHRQADQDRRPRTQRPHRRPPAAACASCTASAPAVRHTCSATSETSPASPTKGRFASWNGTAPIGGRRASVVMRPERIATRSIASRVSRGNLLTGCRSV